MWEWRVVWRWMNEWFVSIFIQLMEKWQHLRKYVNNMKQCVKWGKIPFIRKRKSQKNNKIISCQWKQTRLKVSAILKIIKLNYFLTETHHNNSKHFILLVTLKVKNIHINSHFVSFQPSGIKLQWKSFLWASVKTLPVWLQLWLLVSFSLLSVGPAEEEQACWAETTTLSSTSERASQWRPVRWRRNSSPEPTCCWGTWLPELTESARWHKLPFALIGPPVPWSLPHSPALDEWEHE